MARTRRRRKEGRPSVAGRCKRTGKLRYRDSLGAEIALSSTKASRSTRREESRAYRCEFCHGWHLTAQSKRVIA